MKQMRRMTIVAALVATAAALSFAVNASPPRSRIAEYSSVEMIYVPSTMKLGIVVTNEAGEKTEGYILRNVTDVVGKHDLSAATKYGEGKLLGTTLQIDSAGPESAVIRVRDRRVPVLLEAEEGTTSLRPPCTWVCDGAKDFDWWDCFKCCLISTQC